MRRIYFAHPVSDFGTPRQAEALEAITAFYTGLGQRIQIISPDLPEHQEGYAKKGMPYFRDLVDTCNDLVFMRFPDGSIGAGVAQEIRWAAACRHIREVHNGKLYDLTSQPGPVLSIDGTRAMLKSLAPSPQPSLVGRGTPEYAAAEAAFTEYFVRNYPGPDTIIYNPNWHAPKLFAAAAAAIRATATEGGR